MILGLSLGLSAQGGFFGWLKVLDLRYLITQEARLQESRWRSPGDAHPVEQVSRMPARRNACRRHCATLTKCRRHSENHSSAGRPIAAAAATKLEAAIGLEAQSGSDPDGSSSARDTDQLLQLQHNQHRILRRSASLSSQHPRIDFTTNKKQEPERCTTLEGSPEWKPSSAAWSHYSWCLLVPWLARIYKMHLRLRKAFDVVAMRIVVPGRTASPPDQVTAPRQLSHKCLRALITLDVGARRCGSNCNGWCENYG